MGETIIYSKLILEGNHYDIGRKKGEFLKKNNPQLIRWLTKKPEDGEYLSIEAANKRLAFFNECSYGLGDEVKGIADALGVSVNNLNTILNAYGVQKKCSCSVTLVTGQKTVDGHSYIGQSYEFGLEDEFSYMIQRAEGSYAHMGFSLFQVGNFDGINEKGLCAAITSLDFTVPSRGEAEGFVFAFLVRIVLDTCGTVREAVEKIESLPVCTNANILLADATGEGVLLEILTKNGHASIAKRKAEPYVYGVNHFLASEHKAICPVKRYFSYAREVLLEQFYQKNSKISKEMLYDILKRKLPDGLCCHAYEEWFGTLRSMLYDVTASKVYVCFGSPQHEHYEEMDLWEKGPDEMITRHLTVEKVSNEFWKEI